MPQYRERINATARVNAAQVGTASRAEVAQLITGFDNFRLPKKGNVPQIQLQGRWVDVQNGSWIVVPAVGYIVIKEDEEFRTTYDV